MKIQHYKRFYLRFIPQGSVEFAKSIGFVESNLPGIVMEMDTVTNPRNRDGYFGKFNDDLATLRRAGAVVDGELTDKAKEALARGKQIDNRTFPPGAPEEAKTPLSSVADIEKAKADKPKK